MCKIKVYHHVFLNIWKYLIHWDEKSLIKLHWSYIVDISEIHSKGILDIMMWKGGKAL